VDTTLNADVGLQISVQVKLEVVFGPNGCRREGVRVDDGCKIHKLHIARDERPKRILDICGCWAREKERAMVTQ
jgi:hypothetical protein